MSDKTRVVGSAMPGCWLAVFLSYVINQSLWWCFLHFFCGWIYVIYWLFSYTEIRDWMMQWVVR